MKNNKNTFVDEVMKILKEKYNDNMLYYSKAEKEVEERYNLAKKLGNIDVNTNITSLIGDKTTFIDLNNDTISLMNTNTPIPLLAYSLDYLNVRRMFPFSLSTLLNSNKNKDTAKIKNTNTNEKYQKTLNIMDWVKNRVLHNNFTVNNISVNKNTGIINYNTLIRDLSIGNALQYITVKMDVNKIMNIEGESKRIKEWSDDYDSLFTYFMAFGYNEIYARCTCNEYTSKCGRKVGIANYMCSHILYSLCQLPYYLLYTLR